MSLTGMAGDNDKPGDSLLESKLISVLKSKFLGRKFLSPLAYTLLVWANKRFDIGFTNEELLYIAGIVVAFVAGETKLDSDRIKAASSVATAAASPSPVPTATVSVTQETK